MPFDIRRPAECTNTLSNALSGGDYTVVKGSPVQHVREFLNRLELSQGMVCSNRIMWDKYKTPTETKQQRVNRLAKRNKHGY